MSDFGQIYMSIDGENISVSGNVTFNNLNGGETSFEANMDRSLHSTFTPMVATAEIENLSACTIPIEELVAIANRCSSDGERIGVGFALTGACADTPKTIYFADAKLGGTINLDGSTGQVSGFVIASPDILINGKNVRSLGQ